MTVAHAHITAEDLWRMPNDCRRELVKGEVREMAPAGSGHGSVELRIGARLQQYVEAHQLGECFGAETGYVIARGPDTVRAPDASFIATPRLPAGGLPESFFLGAPDLAAEVLSPSDRLHEVDEKVADWLNAGTRLVWVINPRRRSVTVHRSAAPPVTLTENDTLSGEDVIPGFECKVRELFR